MIKRLAVCFMPLGGEKSAVGYSVCDGCPRVQKNIIFLQTGVLTTWLVKLTFWLQVLVQYTVWTNLLGHLHVTPIQELLGHGNSCRKASGFVLMLVSEQVQKSAVIELAQHCRLLCTW